MANSARNIDASVPRGVRIATALVNGLATSGKAIEHTSNQFPRFNGEIEYMDHFAYRNCFATEEDFAYMDAHRSGGY